jgi:hypothetical protein
MSWKIRPRTQNARTYIVRRDEANTRRRARRQPAETGYQKGNYDGNQNEAES